MKVMTEKFKAFFFGCVIAALITCLIHTPMLHVFAQSAPLGPYGWLTWTTGNTAIDTATLSVGQMTGILTGTPTAGATYTTPTATALCGLFPFSSSGASQFGWPWVVKNTSLGANTITVGAGSGVTVTGTATAAQNAVRHFMIVLEECRVGQVAAARIYSLTTGAF